MNRRQRSKNGKRLFSRASVLVSVLIMMIAGTIFVMAEPTAPLDLNTESSSTRDLGSNPDQTVDAVAGNVTEITIDALSITNFWQGFYGNITGYITLDDANNNTMYNWSITTTQGEVYATRNSGVDFSTVACANATEIYAERTAIGQSGGEGDDIATTFNSNTHPTFDVGTGTIGVNSCNATNTYVSDTEQSSDFYEVLLADSAGVFVYTAIIDSATTGFDDRGHDFQMLVGENGTDPAVTPYYFYVEIN